MLVLFRPKFLTFSPMTRPILGGPARANPQTKQAISPHAPIRRGSPRFAAILRRRAIPERPYFSRAHPQDDARSKQLPQISISISILRELCFANECPPVLRRVSKRLGSRPACVAKPGKAGQSRARPGTAGQSRANRRIDSFLCVLGVQNDALFHSSNGIQPVSFRNKLVSARLFGKNTTLLRPRAALRPGGCRGAQSDPKIDDFRAPWGPWGPGAGGWEAGRGEGEGEEKLYITTPDQPLHGGFTGSSSRSSSICNSVTCMSLVCY